MNKVVKGLSKIFNYLWEIIIYFVFGWAFMLAFAFTYALPNLGIALLVLSIGLTFVPRLYNKFIKPNREKDNKDGEE